MTNFAQTVQLIKKHLESLDTPHGPPAEISRDWKEISRVVEDYDRNRDSACTIGALRGLKGKLALIGFDLDEHDTWKVP